MCKAISHGGLIPLKSNIHDVIWSHNLMIYKSQSVHYKIIWLYVAYDVLYRIELLSIHYNTTKSYATKSQCVYWAKHSKCDDNGFLGN